MYHLGRNVKFVIMCSVFDTDVNLSTIFDIKGSTLGRSAKAGDSVRKDNDLRERIASNGGLGFEFKDPETRCRLKRIVEKDVEWLRKVNVIDYSMLIGLGTDAVGPKPLRLASLMLDDDETKFSGEGSSSRRPDGGYELLRAAAPMEDGYGSTCEEELDVLFLGIIDILQQYSGAKWIESLAKGVLYKNQDASCTNPRNYANRFRKFFDEYTRSASGGDGHESEPRAQQDGGQKTSQEEVDRLP